MNLNLVLMIFLLISCTHGHHPHGKNASNQHMHKKSHAELIKAFDDPARDEWQKPQAVLKIRGDLRNKKLIEIGAGSGYFTKYFFKAGANVVAADVDTTFLEHIQKTLPQVHTKKIPFDDPKMEDNKYDVAFTSNTYHHIDERVPYLKKLLKGLKSGGKFVVVDFKKVEDVDGPPLKMRLEESLVVEELMLAGFTKVKVDNKTLPRQYVVIGIN